MLIGLIKGLKSARPGTSAQNSQILEAIPLITFLPLEEFLIPRVVERMLERNLFQIPHFRPVTMAH